MRKTMLKYVAMVFIALSSTSVFAGTTSVASIAQTLDTHEREASRFANAASDIVTINFTNTSIILRDPNGTYNLTRLTAARGYYDLLAPPGYVSLQLYTAAGTLFKSVVVKGRDMILVYQDDSGYIVRVISAL